MYMERETGGSHTLCIQREKEEEEEKKRGERRGKAVGRTILTDGVQPCLRGT
jgi:hypothetical protein